MLEAENFNEFIFLKKSHREMIGPPDEDPSSGFFTQGKNFS